MLHLLLSAAVFMELCTEGTVGIGSLPSSCCLVSYHRHAPCLTPQLLPSQWTRPDEHKGGGQNPKQGCWLQRMHVCIEAASLALGQLLCWELSCCRPACFHSLWPHWGGNHPLNKLCPFMASSDAVV
mmetsp:Transcript_32371/g.91728  ORF Transcript_32371/g.91728 Transcript_32371/m.91728 type:complete len:127 (-) Transcript_32371:896-1276(-)